MIKSIVARLGLDLSSSKDRKKIVIVLVVVILLIIGCVSLLSEKKDNGLEVFETNPSVSQNLETTGTDDAFVDEIVDTNNPDVVGKVVPPIFIYVDVAGAVLNPGVIALPPDSRVTDAIDAAGGLSSNASLKSINRALKLNDGEKVYIPTREEEETSNSEDIIAENNGITDNGSSRTETSANARVNINTADLETLQLLVGVGPSTAQKIIDYRRNNGNFQAIEDLMDVSGIGQKTFDKMKDEISVK